MGRIGRRVDVFWGASTAEAEAALIREAGFDGKVFQDLVAAVNAVAGVRIVELEAGKHSVVIESRDADTAAEIEAARRRLRRHGRRAREQKGKQDRCRSLHDRSPPRRAPS